jgi:hypothetical protein
MTTCTRILGRRLCACLCLALAAPGASADVTLTFSEPDFDWLAQGTSSTPYHIWTTGDYWTQTFNATGQASAGHMDLRLFINDNTLSAGAHVDLSVLLNNTMIGSLSIPVGFTGAQNYSFNFSTIVGPNYNVRLLETNTVPSGAGAVSMGLGGSSFVTLVPEPTGAAIAAALGVLLTMRRRRNGTRDT